MPKSKSRIQDTRQNVLKKLNCTNSPCKFSTYSAAAYEDHKKSCTYIK